MSRECLARGLPAWADVQCAQGSLYSWSAAHVSTIPSGTLWLRRPELVWRGGRYGGGTGHLAWVAATSWSQCRKRPDLLCTLLFRFLVKIVGVSSHLPGIITPIHKSTTWFQKHFLALVSFSFVVTLGPIWCLHGHLMKAYLPQPACCQDNPEISFLHPYVFICYRHMCDNGVSLKQYSWVQKSKENSLNLLKSYTATSQR